MSATAPRRAAYEVLRRVFEDGAWADRALPAALKRHAVAESERGLAQRLAYGAVQRRGTADFLIGRFSRRPVAELDAPLLAALRLGTYELLFSDAPAHAAVDQAVELAKSAPGASRGAGLVNAVLRRVAESGSEVIGALSDDDPGEAAIAHSHPDWLARMWWAELGGAAAVALMRAGNRPAETALRVNELRLGRDRLIAELTEAGVDATPAPGPPPLDARESLVIGGALGPAGAAAIEGGSAVGQSRASAAVMEILDPRPGERILDLCAGPGLKTTQIAARLGNDGSIRSAELRPQRAESIRTLAQRLGAEVVEVVVADATCDDLGAGYDRVLVDPPCTDLGTLASRPDLRWRRSESDPDRLAGVQRLILERAACALRPGGTLAYSTCTVSARENEQLVSALVEQEGERLGLVPDNLGEHFPALASPHDPRFLQTRPDRDSTDGFFLARLRRKAR